MWLRRKKTAAAAAPEFKSPYATDIMPWDESEPSGARFKRLSNAIKNSFQRDNLDIVSIGANGAMDAVASNIQQQKAFNSFGIFNPNFNEAQLLYYAGQGFIGYQNCAMVAQNWLVDKACRMPALDAMRHGYELTVNDGQDIDPEVLDYIAQRDKEFGVKEKCVEFLNLGRVFGIRIAIFKVDSPDPTYYEKPFNPDGILPGSYKGITEIDPYWITPQFDMESASDPASLHFYEPTWWQVNGIRYHRTHLCIMRNNEIADILKPTYLYGGVSVPQRIAERVFAAERTANEAPQLAMSKRLIAVFMDLTKAAANRERFQERMAWWMQQMNNFGVKILGEGEKLEQHDISLADVDDVIMTQFQLVAAASGVPVTKLLGTTPKGFNATGEYDESSYHEELESMQEHHLSPLVERHHLLLMRSEIIPKFKVEFKTTLAWKPVDSPTAMEQAELNNKKADTDAKLIQAGVIDGFDARKRITVDADSGYNGIPTIVPGGPGDREHEQEMQQAALEQPDNATSKEKK